MMKLLISIALLFLSFSTSFSQWTRVQQLPSANIFTFYKKDSVLFAGGKSIIYFSKDSGQTWDSTGIIPLSSFVDNIIVYKNEWYASVYSKGVYKSADGGSTWQNIGAGILPFVSDFCEFNGDLYAATLGGSVFKLDPVRLNKWLLFNNGLSTLSLNMTSIAGNSKTLIAGTLANGLYDYLSVNSINWEERFLAGHITPTEGVYDIIASHDSLFAAGSTGKFYMSTDNGISWSIFGNRVPSSFTSLAEARQALLIARKSFNGVNNTSFYYIKKNSLQKSFIPFSYVPDHITYKLEVFGDKLWDASSAGLFYMPLSTLPGISSTDDAEPIITLPIRFISANAQCKGSKILVNWKTDREKNISRYDIERSDEGGHWIVIGQRQVSDNSNIENSYSYTADAPLENTIYRIAAHEFNAPVQYSSLLHPFCTVSGTIALLSNPVHDQLLIHIVMPIESQVLIKLFDSKGGLVNVKKENLSRGANQVSVGMQSMANGVYHLSVEGNNGEIGKAVSVIKQ